jgi:hypothetical protein
MQKEKEQMNPNNPVLTKLATACDGLLKRGQLPSIDFSQCRDLLCEWDVVVSQHANPFAQADFKHHVEAHANDLAVRMVDFLASNAARRN